MNRSGGNSVVRRFVQRSAGFSLPDAAPLLEEKGNARGEALIADRPDPIGFERASAVTAFAADDHPGNAAEIDRAEVFQKRFDREKSHACSR